MIFWVIRNFHSFHLKQHNCIKRTKYETFAGFAHVLYFVHFK